MNWNFDISQAPKGFTTQETRRTKKGEEYTVEVFNPQIIIAAGNGGVVTISKWLPKTDRGEGERWDMFTKATPPLAWMPWPEHPLGSPGGIK